MKISSIVEDSTTTPSPLSSDTSRFDDASSDDVDVAGNKKKDFSSQHVPMQIVGFGCEKGQCCKDVMIKLQQQLLIAKDHQLEAEKQKFYLSRDLDVANQKLHRAELEILRMKEQVSNSHEQKKDKDREGVFADMLKSELKTTREKTSLALKQMAEKISKDNEAQHKQKSLSISKRLSYLEGKLTTEIKENGAQNKQTSLVISKHLSNLEGKLTTEFKSEIKTSLESQLNQDFEKNLESINKRKSEMKRIRENHFEEMTGNLSDFIEEQFKLQELRLMTRMTHLEASISKQVMKGGVEMPSNREKEQLMDRSEKDVVSSPVSGRTSDRKDLRRGIFERDRNQIKLLIIGETGVGKSSLLQQFSVCVSNRQSPLNRFGDKSRIIELDGKTVKLEIWDSFGAEHVTSNYRGADGIICVYDVTDRRSFKSAKYWWSRIERYAPENFIKLLIGNKFDLSRRRFVTFDEGMELTDPKGCGFIETSAKTPTNVERALNLIALQMRKYQSVDCGQ